MVVKRYHSVIETDYHQFTIEAGPLRELIHGQYPNLPLAMFADDIIRVNVGIRYGPVNVTIEVHDTPPEYDDSNWEDSVEGDLEHHTEEGVKIAGFWDDIEAGDGETNTSSVSNITSPGKRRYRVRIYARGKSIRFDGSLFGAPVEDYLIHMWLTTESRPPVQIKHTSGR